MELKELLQHYRGLTAAEQMAFAGMVRAHQLFNATSWREELARRSRLLETEGFVPIERIEQLMKEMEDR